jgi:hypothetical protein
MFFFTGRRFITSSNSLLVIHIFKNLHPVGSVLVGRVYLGNYPFPLGFPIDWHPFSQAVL